MAVLIDFKKHLQEILDQKASDTFFVSNTRNLNTDKNKINVVITALAGNVYKDSATIPYMVEVVSKKPDKIIDIFTSIAKEKNGKSFIEVVEEGEETKEYTVFEFYSTPSITDKDLDYETNQASRLVMFVNCNVLFEVSNVSKIEIDNEELDFISGSLAYGIEPFSLRESGNSLNYAMKKSATTSLQIAMVNKTCNFTNKVFQILFGTLDGNNIFQCKITLTNGLVATLPMLINENTFNFAKNSPNLPSLNITLTMANE